MSFLSSAVLVGKCRAYAQSQFDLRGRRSVPGALPSHHSLPGCSQSCFQPQPDVYNPQTLTFQWLLSNKLSSLLSHRPRLRPHCYLLPPISPALLYFYSASTVYSLLLSDEVVACPKCLFSRMYDRSSGETVMQALLQHIHTLT